MPRPTSARLLVLFGALTLGLSAPAEAGKKKKKKKEAPAAEAPAAEAPAAEAPAPDAAPAEFDVILPCSWDDSFVFTYEKTSRRADSRNPLLEQMEFSSAVTITSLGEGDPARFRYATADMQVHGPEAVTAAAQPRVDRLAALVPPMELRMEGGNLVAVENFQEVADGTWAATRDDVAAEAQAATEQMIRSPETGMALLLKEPMKFFSMHCVAMNLGEALESEVAHPNPFGGPPIPGFSRVTLTELDAEAGVMVIETLDRTDPGALNSVLEGVMQKFAAEGMSEEEMAAKLEQVKAEMPPIETVLTGKMVYSTIDGFPHSIEIRQQIGAGDAIHRVEEHTWTRTAVGGEAEAE